MDTKGGFGAPQGGREGQPIEQRSAAGHVESHVALALGPQPIAIVTYRQGRRAQRTQPLHVEHRAGKRGGQCAIAVALELEAGDAKRDVDPVGERDAAAQPRVARTHAGRPDGPATGKAGTADLGGRREPTNVVTRRGSQILEVEPIDGDFGRSEEAARAAQADDHSVGARQGLRFEGRGARDAHVVGDDLKAMRDGDRSDGGAMAGDLLEPPLDEPRHLPLPKQVQTAEAEEQRKNE